MSPAEDERYVPVDLFDVWATVPVDPGRWSRVLSLVDELGHEGDLRWLEGPFLASSYQSGAVEGFNAGDRGVTATLLDALPGWEVVVNDREERRADAAAFVEALREAYQMALDVVTGSQPVTESWIRQVHEVACGPQARYRARTPLGDGEVVLPRGTYKAFENHVRTPDGAMHFYAPVLDTPVEMATLVRALGSTEFERAAPAVQAAYAHYGLTHIHPFTDGNGRVARVLASIYLLRGSSLPLFFFSDQKERYFDALRAADDHDPRPLVQFVLGATEDLAGILVQRSRAETARRAGEANGDDARRRWSDAVAAAERFAGAVSDARDAAVEAWGLRGDRKVRDIPTLPATPNLPGPRPVRGDIPQFPGRAVPIEVRFTADDVLTETISVTLDRKDLAGRPVVGHAEHSGLRIDARIDELWPTLSMSLSIRLRDWMDQVVADVAGRVDAALSSPADDPA